MATGDVQYIKYYVYFQKTTKEPGDTGESFAGKLQGKMSVVYNGRGSGRNEQL